MKNLPIQFADWQPACTPQADKAPAAVGPSVAAGLGGASVDDFRRFLDSQYDLAQEALSVASGFMRDAVGSPDFRVACDRYAAADARIQQLDAAFLVLDEFA